MAASIHSKGASLALPLGTGSTLALLPPQNATGNFVKVVQRLPVRIDVVDYDPDKLPLFVGLSVELSVDVKSYADSGRMPASFSRNWSSPRLRRIREHCSSSSRNRGPGVKNPNAVL